MTSNYFKNAINYLRVVIAAFFCGVIILLFGGAHIYNQVLQLRTGIIDIPFDADNVGKLLGAGLVDLIFFVPVLYCGAAFGRFCLRAAPPRLSGRVRFGPLILFVLPALLSALVVVNFLLGFLFFPEAFQRDRSLAINTSIFGVLFLAWFGAFVFVLLKRHLKPLSFLNKPYVLFLRRFSKFSDRTVTSLVLRQTTPDKPITFLVPTQSRAGDWNPFLVGFAGMKLLHPFRSVPIIVKSKITEWEQAMQALIEGAQFVIIDISETSDAIDTELEMINQAGCWQKAILLKTVSANTADRCEQKLGSQATQIVYYRKSWPRAIPRMIFGFFALAFAGAFVVAAIDGALKNGPIVNLFSVLFGILGFVFIYVPFFVRPSIDRAAKLSLKRILRDRRVILSEGPHNLSLERARD